MSAYLPWLLVLACPLMMMWMMRGMPSHGNEKSPSDASADSGLNTRGPDTTAEPDCEWRSADLEREVAELRGGGVHLDKRPHGGSASRS